MLFRARSPTVWGRGFTNGAALASDPLVWWMGGRCGLEQCAGGAALWFVVELLVWTTMSDYFGGMMCVVEQRKGGHRKNRQNIWGSTASPHDSGPCIWGGSPVWSFTYMYIFYVSRKGQRCTNEDKYGTMNVEIEGFWRWSGGTPRGRCSGGGD